MKILVLALALLIGGCAAMSREQALVVTGESLKAVGTEFVDVAGMYKNGCDVTKVIKPADCQAFRVFGEKFQRSYPVAVKLWESARTANDSATQSETEKVVRQLAADLSAFAVLMIQAYGGGK